MEEKLIEAVKMHPFLFDKSSSLFRNKYLKDRVWQAVAASTGVSEDHCKGRWKSLLDRFVREIGYNKVKSGAAAEEKVEWCYMEPMRFLTKHVGPRKTSSNIQWMNISEQPSCSQTPPMPQNEEAIDKEQSENSELNISQCSEDTNSAKSTKRQRVVNELRERFDRLVGTIESVIAAKAENVPSKNSTILKLLDECLLRKSDEYKSD